MCKRRVCSKEGGGNQPVRCCWKATQGEGRARAGAASSAHRSHWQSRHMVLQADGLKLVRSESSTFSNKSADGRRKGELGLFILWGHGGMSGR